MRRLLFGALFLIAAVPAFAQTRTWVASTGVDSGSCGITTPCRTIAFALTVVAAGGDIVMQDSAGYGSSITISKAVNIYGPPGVFGSLTILTATDKAIWVTAGSTDIVRIKGLNILGLDPTMGVGVFVDNCKRTELENMTINHIGDGVKVDADVKVVVNNLTISDTTIGIWSRGTNTAASPYNAGCMCYPSPPLKVQVRWTKIIGTGIGVQLDAGSLQMDSNSNISFATTDPYIIEANAASCSSVPNFNGQMNNYTGVYNATCMCYVEDLRNGMTTLGNCNAN